jgi:putative transposase
MIEFGNKQISVSRQCELLELPRSTLYYKAGGINNLNLELMRLLDEQYTRTPFYGSLKLTAWLRRQGYEVNRKRVIRLMKIMGIQAIYQKPRLSKPGENHRIYPYLLTGMKITYPDQVWCADITYIRLKAGFVYLVAIMDWFSRYVLAWELSNTLDICFCTMALEKALIKSKPKIFNTDQGSQFTSIGFTDILKENEIRISMDGKGRVVDNIFIERLWRSLKYEEVYLNDYQSVKEAASGIRRYLDFYNFKRLHQSLGYMTPYEIYSKKSKQAEAC